MARWAWHKGFWLSAVAAALAVAAANASPPSAGTAAAASATAASLATPAGVQAEHRRQRRLCAGLALAAVHAECLRQADRSRDQALARLRSTAAPSPQRAFSP